MYSPQKGGSPLTVVAVKHYPALDGLRGLAAMAVVFSHASNANVGVIYGVPLAGLGRFAVWLFFVLSAFLLTRQALVALRAGEYRSWLMGYAARRFLRIYPLLCFALTLDLVLSRISPEDTLRTVLLGYAPGIYWSIPPEFIFYFVIPVAAWLAYRSPLAGSLLLIALAAYGETFPFALHFWPLVSTFVAGSFAAFLFEWRPDVARTISHAWPVAFVVMPFMLQAPIAALAPGLLEQRPWDWNVSIGIAWVPVVLACASGLRPMAWFATRPMRFLGAVSFGTYLLHPVIVAGAVSAGLAGRVWAGPIVLVAVIVAAWLAHILIERPALRAVDWFQEGRPVRLPAPSVVEGPAPTVVQENADPNRITVT
jgi:peptidoglycan/LPS O-acetylase OafA/YrhL